jgi:hypothetical protein
MTTLLDAFCRKNGITTTELAAASFLNRPHTCRIRAGKVIGVTIATAKHLAKGASRILRRKVAVAELFDLDYFCRWPP